MIEDLKGKRLLLIVNPAAGRGSIIDKLAQVEAVFQSAGCLITKRVTEAPDDAEELAFSLAAEHDIIVSAGGDGTLYQIINGMLRSGENRPIGHIPCGSTNEFASAHGIPKRAEQAAERIVSGGEITVDVGRFGERYFIGTAAFGAFSWMGYSTDQSMKNRLGYSAYILEGFKGMKKNGPHHVKVIADGMVHEGNYLFGAVCATDELSRRVRLGKNKDTERPRALELLLVRRIKRLSDAGSIVRSLYTGEYEDSALLFARADEITIENEPGLIWSIGGESSGEFDKVKVSALKNCLRIRGAAK